MNVALPTELEKRVQESVERGDFPTREEFFRQAAELLLDLKHDDGSPLPVDAQWEPSVEALLQEGIASGEPTEMMPSDWQEIERQGAALIRARKRT